MVKIIFILLKATCLGVEFKAWRFEDATKMIFKWFFQLKHVPLMVHQQKEEVQFSTFISSFFISNFFQP